MEAFSQEQVLGSLKAMRITDHHRKNQVPESARLTHMTCLCACVRVRVRADAGGAAAGAGRGRTRG